MGGFGTRQEFVNFARAIGIRVSTKPIVEQFLTRGIIYCRCEDDRGLSQQQCATLSDCSSSYGS